MGRALLTFDWYGTRVAVVPECLGYRSFIALAILGGGYLCMATAPTVAGVVRTMIAAAFLAAVGNLLRVATLLVLMPLLRGSSLYWSCHDLAGYSVMVFEVFALTRLVDRMA